MTDYISREAIQERINRIVEVNNLRTDLAWFTPYGVNALIEEIPAAALRPVVLCRDCTYCRKGKASLECEKHTYAWNNTNRWVEEDDFCSWGVKREKS